MYLYSVLVDSEISITTSEKVVHYRQYGEKVFITWRHVLGLQDEYMRAVEWQNSFITELDITSTELNEETLRDMLLRMPGFNFLAVGHCEFFSDQVILLCDVITFVTCMMH